MKERFDFPWYQKGLKFSCTQCGKCCTGAAGFVWVTEQEISQMAEFLGLSIATFKCRYVKRRDQGLLLVEKKTAEGRSCIFYKNKQCQVYGARPLQCQTYPFWPENLLTEKSWQQTAQECEGIRSDAPLVSAHEIEKQRQAQHNQNPEEIYVAGDQ